MSFEFIGSVVAMTIMGLVLSFSIYIVLKPGDFTLKICLAIGAALGMVIGFWAPIMDRFSVGFIWHQTVDFSFIISIVGLLWGFYLFLSIV